MDFDSFRQHAEDAWERIPDSYKVGVDGLLVEREAKRHPSREEVFTLGECITESYPSDWGGPDTTRSWVALYHGSFRRVAEQDDHFDWDEEIWETLTHELRHHLESLADSDELGDVDYAVEENFKRRDGEPFDPWFYRAGEAVGEGLWQVEDEIFQEHAFREPAAHVDVAFAGRRWRVRWPDVHADVVFVELEEVAAAPLLYTLVLARSAGTWQTLRSLFGGRAPRVEEVIGAAEPLGLDPAAGTG